MIDGGLNNEELLKHCTESEEAMASWTPADRANRVYDMCNAAIINEHQSHYGESTVKSVSVLQRNRLRLTVSR